MRWSEFKRGKLWVYMETGTGNLGGFVTTSEGVYQALKPVSISSKPSKTKFSIPMWNGLYQNLTVLGTYENLGDAKDRVEVEVGK